MDTPGYRSKAFSAAFEYLTNDRYRFQERYPWSTFVQKLPSSVDTKATLDNMYFVEGLDETPDYFGVLVTLKSGSKPAALQVSVPDFTILRCDAVPLPKNVKAITSVIDITRLTSLPRGPLYIKFRIKDLRRPNNPVPEAENDFVFDVNDGVVPQPTLVWKPCRQSFSPFLPFYKFDLRNPELNLPVEYAYLRADFQVEPDVQTVSITGFAEFDTNSLGF